MRGDEVVIASSIHAAVMFNWSGGLNGKLIKFESSISSQRGNEDGVGTAENAPDASDLALSLALVTSCTRDG